MEKCIFCGFVNGKRNLHRNKFPFRILKEMRHSISFLSIDVPKKTGINVLVIPKRHFEFFEDVPNRILKDIMEHSKIIIKALKKKYSGVNLILNDGWEANQRVPHVHFHIYPRKKDDGFFEGFDKVMKRNKNKQEFERMNLKVSRLLED